MPPSAVITADIVNSSRLPKGEEQKLLGSLKALLEPYRFEFYRGDSFQVYLKEGELALWLVLQVRAAARCLPGEGSAPLSDIRAGIGIGEVELPVHSLGTTTGEAFVLSGRGFDELHRSTQRLAMQSGNALADPGLRVMAQFADFIFGRLTVKQSAVVLELLQHHTQQETARRLNKSQATINKHAQAAGWSDISRLLIEYRNLIQLL